MIRPHPANGESLADYLTRLEAEATTWRLFACLVLPWLSPAVLALVLDLLPGAPPRPPWPGLPIATAVFAVAGWLVANLLWRVAWLLVDPNRPHRGGRSA
jgi:hypothetical protein